MNYPCLSGSETYEASGFRPARPVYLQIGMAGGEHEWVQVGERGVVAVKF